MKIAGHKIKEIFEGCERAQIARRTATRYTISRGPVE